jgi:uncharacterized protein
MMLDWVNLSVLLLCAVGHAALVVAVVNRVHARRFSNEVLHRTRHTHDFVIVVVPLLIFWLAGLRGPELLFGGSWHRLPLPILAYLVICGTVALSLPFIAVDRWRRSGPCALQISNHSQTLDIARRLGFRPVGPGPYRFMTSLPLNEFLTVQVSTKEFTLPRLPDALDGLSILHLSDFHFIGTVDRPYFEEIAELGASMQPDLVVFSGDLLDREHLIEWIPATLGRLSAPLGCYFVLGNHDWYLSNTDDIRRRLEECGWRDMAGQTVEIRHQGHSLVLCGSEMPWMGTQPELAHAADDAFRILLSHTPDNIEWARRHEVDLMLCGHNHGGQIRLPLFGPVYSPSKFGCRYAGGVYWEPPTLMCVSRGISGRHPLRWRCPPELTKLVLRDPTTRNVAGSGERAVVAGRVN